MAVGDFLDRFRPAGAPGPAAGAVPADRRADLEAEMEQVFALLTDAEAERRQVIEQAGRDARRIREEAGTQAARLVDEAGSRSEATRADAAAQVRAAAHTEHDRLIAEATEEAGRIRRDAESRLAAQVDRAVAVVRALAVEPGPGPSDRGGAS